MDSTIEQEWVAILKSMKQVTDNYFWQGSPWQRKVDELLEKYELGRQDAQEN